MKAEERERVAAEEARDYWGDLYAWADEAGVLNRNDGCFPVLSIKHAREVDQRMNRKAKMIAEDTMRKRMQRAEVLGVLRKARHGEYELLPNRKTGNESESE
jgi:hypothetical protein